MAREIGTDYMDFQRLLPLQGVGVIAGVPRAMPWARSRCTDLAEPVEFLAAHFCYG